MHQYVKELRRSTLKLLNKTTQKICKTHTFYNYIILNASKCTKILNFLSENEAYISTDIVKSFKSCCLYVGKGSNKRKFIHIRNARNRNIIHNKNISTIQKLIERKKGIMLFHFPTEVNHFEAHSREYALIKAVGLINLNNYINGTAYGSCALWNEVETQNFGDMMLYNAIKICVSDPPPILLQ